MEPSVQYVETFSTTCSETYSTKRLETFNKKCLETVKGDYRPSLQHAETIVQHARKPSVQNACKQLKGA